MRIACTAWLLAAPLVAVAQPAEEEPPSAPPEDSGDLELIVVAEQGLPRVAGSAYVVEEAELERHEYDDIHRVVRTVPGVYAREEDGLGLRPNLGIRGANSDRSAKLTLMEDGVLFAPAPYAAPAAYYFPLSTRMVAVEVFKGPAAIQHGPHTVGGAINLVTRPIPESGVDGALDLAVGQREAAKMHVWAGVGGPRFGALAEFVQLTHGGFKELDGGGPTGFDRTEGMLKLRAGTDPALTHRHTLRAKVSYATERSSETYLGLSADDFEATPLRRYAASALDAMQWRRGHGALTWHAELGPDVAVHTTAYISALDRSWTKLNRFAGGPDLHTLLQADEAGQAAVYLAILRGEEDSASADQLLQIGTNDRRFLSLGLQSRLQWRESWGDVDNELELGVRLHRDIVRRLHTEAPHAMRSGVLEATDAPTETWLDSHSTAEALAVHAHNTLRWRSLNVIPGVRLEGVRTARADADATGPVTRAALLPGLGALVHALPWADVFAGVHRGFSPVAPGQPVEVRPESSWSYEAGVRAGDLGTRAEVVGYWSDYRNLTGQCTLSGGCDETQVDRQYNGGKAWIAGVETLLRHEVLLPGALTLPVSASYTLTHATFRTGFVSDFPQFGTVEVGDRLPYVPPHRVAITLGVEHPRAGASLSGAWRSGMRDQAGSGALTEADVPPLAQLDVALHAQLTQQLRAYATLNNATGALTPVSWRPFGARPSAPRQLTGGLTWRGR